MYLLVVNGSKIGTKYFTSLYVSVCKAYKIGLKGGQPSTHFPCTLQKPYIIPGHGLLHSVNFCDQFLVILHNLLRFRNTVNFRF